MPTFIKTGYWEKLQKGFKNYLNLDELIQSLSPPSAITADELDAIQSANAPDASNPFATIGDIPTVSAETDPVVGAITGIPTSNGAGVISQASAEVYHIKVLTQDEYDALTPVATTLYVIIDATTTTTTTIP